MSDFVDQLEQVWSKGRVIFGIVGERINTSRKKVREAVVNRDASYIREEVKNQQAAGAEFIDVNAGACIDRAKRLVYHTRRNPVRRLISAFR